MRTILVLATVLFVGVPLAFAQPTTAPSQPRNTTVLIIPFKQVGDTTTHGWVSAALQENLVAQAALVGNVMPKTLDKPLAAVDAADALRAGHEAQAGMVIFGSYQVSDEVLRVSGQVIDVASGRVIGKLSVTDPMKEFFHAEDVLAAQLNPLFPQQANTGWAQVSNDATPAPNPNQLPNSAQSVYPYAAANPDTSTYVTPYVYTAPDYGYNYAYPYYDYGYPYYDYGYGYPFFGYGGIYLGGGYYGGYGRGFAHGGGFGHGGFAHGGFGGGGFAHGGFGGGGMHSFAGGHGGFSGGGHGR